MIPIDTFRAALAQFAAGVGIVTTANEGDRRGVTATAISSVCADPPMVLACVNSDTGTFKMIADAGVFGLNFLDRSHQPLAETFAGRSGLQGDARFAEGLWQTGSIGVPLLQAGATTLACEVEQIVEAGTHGIVIGRVREANVRPIDPLLYHGGNFQALQAKMRFAS